MERDIMRCITFLSRKSQGYLTADFAKLNLTMAEQPFFMALYHYEGVSQEKLTGLVGVDKAATARAVKSMEQKGMLIRLQDENDRRQNKLYLTEHAKALWPEARDTLTSFNARVTEGMDEQTLEAVCQALQRMDQNLSEMRKGRDE